jgi:hypothetical protein
MKQLMSMPSHETDAKQQGLRTHAALTHPMQLRVDESPRQRSQSKRLTQLQERPAGRAANGLPPVLRAGIESLSGMDMRDVTVHRNSSKPAQLNAHAYTQGNQIHLGPGQDRHLPHEAWHVVQQKAGRVSPTAQVAGVAINDSSSLEREADVMGGRAAQLKSTDLTEPSHSVSPASGGVVQRAVGFELEVDIPVSQRAHAADAIAANLRPAAQDWASARVPFPEADPHAMPPVPQAVIYSAVNGGVTVDAVPDKRKLAAGAPAQILEIRVSPIDTANIAGLGATMAHVQNGINPLYNGIHAAAPGNNRFPIPGGIAAMVGLPHGNDPTGVFNNASRANVSWRTYMQATAGIRTDRLQKLHRKIRYGAGVDDPSLQSLRSERRRHREIANDARNAALAVYNNVHAVSPNPDHAVAGEREYVIGFLTLICSYLLGGAKKYRGQGNKNPKNMAALFSRSGFNQLRTQTLSANCEAWIRTNATQFRGSLINATRDADADDRLRSRLFNRLGMAHPTRTVEIFLNDALGRAEDRYTDDEAKSIIPPENVGAARPGGVLEFRRISNPGNNPAAWVAKMQEVITAIHHLNT